MLFDSGVFFDKEKEQAVFLNTFSMNERCGAEWKCEYGENKFGVRTYCGYNEDPDILCQCCGHPTVTEVASREMPERE